MGTPGYQRQNANRVRDLTLKEIEGVLDGSKDYGKDFKKQLLLRLAGSVLPRLQEHTGEDGAPLQIQVLRANGTE
jgi:hypothetical protein